MTREIYTELFDKIKEVLPQHSFTNIHLLTKAKDTQYDQFKKQYILGLDPKGKKIIHKPAEAVIFVGSPETADNILSSIEDKLAQLQSSVPPFKQIFLKFGSGLNPVVLSSYGQNHVTTVVKGVAQAIKINNAQDCIAPKFYVVHKPLLKNFTQELQATLKKLRYGPSTNSHSDYSSLSFCNQKGILYSNLWSGKNFFKVQRG